MLAMTPRERVRRALTMQSPDRAPRDLWMLGSIPAWHREELDELLARYPMDFAHAPLAWRRQPESESAAEAAWVTSPGGPRQPTPTFTGRYTDEWGCEWEAWEPGVVGEVVRPRLGCVCKLKPQDSGGDEPHGSMVLGPLLVAGSQTAELLETVDEPFDAITLPVDSLVKASPMLIIAMGNGNANATPTGIVTKRRVAVAFVTDDAMGA